MLSIALGVLPLVSCVKSIEFFVHLKTFSSKDSLLILLRMSYPLNKS